ncbi:MAG: DedA family protein [Deltaproteobacteria bacterium]|nr:DedA family protein [Deltaproteobacteria bacterium]
MSFDAFIDFCISLFKTLLEIFLHLDVHLNEWLGIFGPWIYLLIFLIIFCETGLVVTPFLPGDSLLFALGAMAATEQSVLKISWLVPLLFLAAVIGDAANYSIGRRVGPRIFNRKESWWLNKKHLLATEAFYEKHGGKTIVIARFMPIIRTFAPFVAGIGIMRYRRFAIFNVTGALLWVLVFLLGGYYFGNIPGVKKNFEFVIVGIIFVSFLPLGYRILKARFA